jgi:hypothetical protein
MVNLGATAKEFMFYVSIRPDKFGSSIHQSSRVSKLLKTVFALSNPFA